MIDHLSTDYNSKEQTKRRIKACSRFYEATRKYFETGGSWIEKRPGAEGPGFQREDVRALQAYLDSGIPDACKLGNEILRRCHLEQNVDLFVWTSLLQAVYRNRSLIEDDVYEKILAHLRLAIAEAAPTWQTFVGNNANHPCMAAVICVLGGQLLGDKQAVEAGRRKLIRGGEVLIRRGLPAEYTSSCYKGAQIAPLAAIVDYAEDDEIRQLALALEIRLWVGALGHYNPPTGETDGPHARDSIPGEAALPHQQNLLYYAVLGDAMPYDPVDFLFQKEERGEEYYLYKTFRTRPHGFRYMITTAIWSATANYHCPKELIEWTLSRSYPFIFRSTVEYCPTDDFGGHQNDKLLPLEEYPSSPGTIYTYSQPDYSLGTADRDWYEGAQCSSFFVLYRKEKKVIGPAEVGTVFARMMVNDVKPRDTYFSEVLNRDVTYVTADYGRPTNIQDRNTALVIYKPKVHCNKNLKSLKVSIIFTHYYGKPPVEVLLGDKKVQTFDEVCFEPCPIYVRDGSVYFAFHPLSLTDLGRDYAVQVEQIENYTMISFVNKTGDAKDYGYREILEVGNGFAAEVSSVEESESFEKFIKTASKGVVYEEREMINNGKYVRHVKYTRDDIALEGEIAPISGGVKFLTVNGKVPCFDRLDITGIDKDCLPLINQGAI